VRRPRKSEPDAAEADERTVRTAALALLAGRDFARQELAGRLIRRGYPASIVESVVERLAAERLQDEGRFAEQLVARHAGRGHGPNRIRMELRERGVPDADGEQALAASSIDWVASATRERQRRFRGPPPRDFRERAKQARFLQYRGFSADQIRAALGPGADPTADATVGAVGPDDDDLEP
jgi:regulatory protein